MNKKDIRIKQRKILTQFADQPEKDAEDQQLLDKIITSDILKNSQSIGITASLPLEVDTSKLIARLWDEGKNVYLARANQDANHTQDFLRYTYRSKLSESSFGVVEVADKDAEIDNELDLVIVPGLAFALDSHQRVGFGGGYYDRFLAKHPQTKTVSLVNSKMIYQTADWNIMKTDIPIDTIITPNKIYQ